MIRIFDVLRTLLLCTCLLPELSLACTTAAWTGGTTGSPQAIDIGDGSQDAVRYSGRCGLRANVATPGFVTDTTPNLEPQMRVRFYVYTGSTAGTQVVFRAHPGDLPNSGSVVDASYDATNQRFSFLVNGSTASTANGSAPRGRWIGVTLSYNANASFNASTQHRGAVSSVTAMATGAATINAVSLGLIAAAGGGTGFMAVDEYESSRSTDPGLLCRGDANGPDGILNGADVTAIRSERHRLGAAVGQPDCTEDGRINVLDMVCVLRRIANGGCVGGGIERGVGAIFRDGFESPAETAEPQIAQWRRGENPRPSSSSRVPDPAMQIAPGGPA